MTTRSRRWRRGATAMFIAAVLVAAVPAAADCVGADAYVETNGQRRYVVPAGSCLAPTPFSEFAGTGPTSFGNGIVRVGGSATVPAPINAPPP